MLHCRRISSRLSWRWELAARMCGDEPLRTNNPGRLQYTLDRNSRLLLLAASHRRGRAATRTLRPGMGGMGEKDVETDTFLVLSSVTE